jgi:hypothetical protein
MFGDTRGSTIAMPVPVPIVFTWVSEHLGTIEAPDAKTAEQIAVKQFRLEGERRRRLIVREQE